MRHFTQHTLMLFDAMPLLDTPPTSASLRLHTMMPFSPLSRALLMREAMLIRHTLRRRC